MRHSWLAGVPFDPEFRPCMDNFRSWASSYRPPSFFATALLYTSAGIGAWLHDTHDVVSAVSVAVGLCARYCCSLPARLHYTLSIPNRNATQVGYPQQKRAADTCQRDRGDNTPSASATSRDTASLLLHITLFDRVEHTRSQATTETGVSRYVRIRTF
jgi:hypothetical protein